MELTVRDRATKKRRPSRPSIPLRVSIAPAVNPTTHPLVFLFSSVGCQGGRARVGVEGPQGVQYTGYKPCGQAQPELLPCGAVAEHGYQASLIVEQLRNATAGPAVSFATGDASYSFTLPAVVRAATEPGPQGVLLQTPLFVPPLHRSRR